MTQHEAGPSRKAARTARKGVPGGTGRKPGKTLRQLTQDERRVLGIIGESDGQVPPGVTVYGICQRSIILYKPGLYDFEVRGLITRLVNRGYVRRDGTEVLRWYTLTSMGRGYLSVGDGDD